MTQLEVENSAQSAFRFSPVSFRAPRFKQAKLAQPVPSLVLLLAYRSPLPEPWKGG
jgi:hypothetical protein